jgi:hypothetical protein
MRMAQGAMMAGRRRRISAGIEREDHRAADGRYTSARARGGALEGTHQQGHEGERRRGAEPWCTVWTSTRDGFGSDTHGNGFECHYLPYFNSNMDTNTNTIEYEYKMDSSNSDLHSDIYLIWNIAS